MLVAITRDGLQGIKSSVRKERRVQALMEDSIEMYFLPLIFSRWFTHQICTVTNIPLLCYVLYFQKHNSPICISCTIVNGKRTKSLCQVKSILFKLTYNLLFQVVPCFWVTFQVPTLMFFLGIFIVYTINAVIAVTGNGFIIFLWYRYVGGTRKFNNNQIHYQMR